jgi:hypothetical protein
MWIELAIAIVGLVSLVVKEAFSASSEAAKENKAYEVNQETFQKAVSGALSKQILTMAKASKGAGNAWDAADGKNETGKPN